MGIKHHHAKWISAAPPKVAATSVSCGVGAAATGVVRKAAALVGNTPCWPAAVVVSRKLAVPVCNAVGSSTAITVPRKSASVSDRTAAGVACSVSPRKTVSLMGVELAGLSSSGGSSKIAPSRGTGFAGLSGLGFAKKSFGATGRAAAGPATLVQPRKYSIESILVVGGPSVTDLAMKVGRPAGYAAAGPISRSAHRKLSVVVLTATLGAATGTLSAKRLPGSARVFGGPVSVTLAFHRSIQLTNLMAGPAVGGATRKATVVLVLVPAGPAGTVFARKSMLYGAATFAGAVPAGTSRKSATPIGVAAALVWSRAGFYRSSGVRAGLVAGATQRAAVARIGSVTSVWWSGPSIAVADCKTAALISVLSIGAVTGCRVRKLTGLTGSVFSGPSTFTFAQAGKPASGRAIVTACLVLGSAKDWAPAAVTIALIAVTGPARKTVTERWGCLTGGGPGVLTGRAAETQVLYRTGMIAAVSDHKDIGQRVGVTAGALVDSWVSATSGTAAGCLARIFAGASVYKTAVQSMRWPAGAVLTGVVTKYSVQISYCWSAGCNTVAHAKDIIESALAGAGLVPLVWDGKDVDTSALWPTGSAAAGAVSKITENLVTIQLAGSVMTLVSKRATTNILVPAGLVGVLLACKDWPATGLVPAASLGWTVAGRSGPVTGRFWSCLVVRTRTGKRLGLAGLTSVLVSEGGVLVVRPVINPVTGVVPVTIHAQGANSPATVQIPPVSPDDPVAHQTVAGEQLRTKRIR